MTSTTRSRRGVLVALAVIAFAGASVHSLRSYAQSTTDPTRTGDGTIIIDPDITLCPVTDVRVVRKPLSVQRTVTIANGFPYHFFNDIFQDVAPGKNFHMTHVGIRSVTGLLPQALDVQIYPDNDLGHPVAFFALGGELVSKGSQFVRTLNQPIDKVIAIDADTSWTMLVERSASTGNCNVVINIQGYVEERCGSQSR